MQDKPARRLVSPFISMVIALGASACAGDSGDLGRTSPPSLLSKAYTGSLSTARVLLNLEEDQELPLTAAEDALRSGAQDLRFISSSLVPTLADGGFSQIAAHTRDLKVERQRFSDFVDAARKVMQIDDARRDLLTGLDAITARRMQAVTLERRVENDRLIRDSVRAMRKHATIYRERLLSLSVSFPDAQLSQMQTAYDEFYEAVVFFHGEIDKHAHMRLGAMAKSSLK